MIDFWVGKGGGAYSVMLGWRDGAIECIGDIRTKREATKRCNECRRKFEAGDMDEQFRILRTVLAVAGIRPRPSRARDFAR